MFLETSESMSFLTNSQQKQQNQIYSQISPTILPPISINNIHQLNTQTPQQQSFFNFSTQQQKQSPPDEFLQFFQQQQLIQNEAAFKQKINK